MDIPVIAFPLHRQHRLVSETANELRSKHGEEASLFWRETAKGLLRQMVKNGVPTQSAEDEVRGLLHAVIAELEVGVMETRG